MFSEAQAIYRRHFGALVLTSALALVPANLVMAGAVVFGLASMGAGGIAEARTHSQQIEEKQHDLQEKPPATPEARDIRVQQLGREAIEGGTSFSTGFLRTAVPYAYAVLIAVVLLLAGLSLAHAALVPLVTDLQAGAATGPARAWAVVASRIGALSWTVFLSASLVALGSLFCVVPGVAVAVGFGFAIPVAMSEGLSGRAALERSWALSRAHWPPLLGMLMLILGFTAAASALSLLAPPGPWRAIISGAVRLVTYPLPLVGLVLLYQRARKLEGVSEVRVSV